MKVSVFIFIKTQMFRSATQHATHTETEILLRYISVKLTECDEFPIMCIFVNDSETHERKYVVKERMFLSFIDLC